MKIINSVFDKSSVEYSFCSIDESALYEVALLEERIFPEDFWTYTSFVEAFNSPACSIFALYNKALTEIAAYGVLYSALDECDIANIAVKLELRRNGLGFQLLSSIFTFAENSGIKRMFLEVRESNKNARALYEKSGFTVIGRRKNYYFRPREDAIIMEKNL